MKQIKTACPLDCWDVCSIELTVNNNEIVKIEGDKSHPITRGFLCSKGYKHVERLNSPKRITSPLKKINNQWVEIGWKDAIGEIGDKLTEILNIYGPSSLLHYTESGHCGLLKNIVTAFFNSLGSVIQTEGSLCWGAGIAAQKLDFGKALSHSPEDHLNSKTIIIWGRNPADTNLHLVPFLKEAKAQGANLILIDPIKTKTFALATDFYQVKPEGDGYLALAMAKIIIESNWVDDEFLLRYSNNYTDFKDHLLNIKMEDLVESSGLTLEEIIKLTRMYALSKPSSIILGYGLQRYKNGGKNIRYIDALAALTGNIGVDGGGVSYANQYLSQWINWKYALNTPKEKGITIKKPLFADFVLEKSPNTIKGIFVTKGNPVIQLPDTGNTIKAFMSIPLKVTIDHFMTDTAALSDYILPCTHQFEEEDFLSSSMWHDYFYYTQQAVSPSKGVKHEFQIFKDLAIHMNLNSYLLNYGNEADYLTKSLEPLLKNSGLDLNTMKGNFYKLTGNDVPWKNKQFSTPSKKFEFILPKDVIDSNIERDLNYPLQLITLHPKNSLHSQHFMDEIEGSLPIVYCNTATIKNYNLATGDKITIESINGSISAIVECDDGILKDLLVLYEGWWLKNEGINRLTGMLLSDIGNQAAYNHCFCKIKSY
ncbi:molybdopterin-dependent oxidoreductase [Alkaliphilus peptidifermentans]|uniref:Anaerobic selenocysteine-containing dehydrogenase n=1 Tax=Alkaliphilus peptidifermentans DSM 18978 TaxID=1120976 RepID=A0A1G5FKD9_9FIRM|nr:molybdopterin-dependent oxidoreductase [Alkaliphilus peptidifermentans]SCY39617.1 Anaerobic selenocysteine-containing dehydrogenase [Alkaliphilus peptidifermentans DSM 18978]